MTEPDWRGALARLEGAYSDRTIRGYGADVRLYAQWCADHGHTALPATPTTLTAYIEHGLAHAAPATISRRLVAIAKVHELLDVGHPLKSAEVALAVRRRRRANGRRPRQAPGLTAALRDRLIAACPETLKGRRDRAMIAVGYDTLARRSELVALRAEDLGVGTSGVAKILIRRAKTDPLGEGRYAYLSSPGWAHLQAWLQAAAITAGPLFRVVSSDAIGEGELNPVAVNRALKAAARRAGLEGDLANRLSGHSMRVGAAQDLVVAGRSLVQIMTAGRWTSTNVLGGYVRDADLNIWG